MTDACTTLSTEAHDLFQALCKAARPSTLFVKATRTDVYDKLKAAGIYAKARSEFQDEFRELIEAGLIDQSQLDKNNILLQGWCSCPRLRAGGRPPAQTSTSSSSYELRAEAKRSSPLRGESLPGRAPRNEPEIDLRTVRIPPSSLPLDPAKWNGQALARYFNEQMLMHWWGQTPGPVNMAAVGSHIARWVHREGIKPEEVKAMIDFFVSDSRNMRASIPAWKSFISRRHILHAKAKKLVSANTHYSDAEWEGRA